MGQQSLALGRALADARSIAAPLLVLGHVALFQHRYEQARSFLEESLRLRQDVGDRGGCAHLLNSLGYLAFFQGQYTRVTAFIAESMRLSQEEGNTLHFMMNLTVLAELAVAQQDLRRAVRLLAARQRLREAIGFLESGLPTFVQDRLEWLQTSTRMQLGVTTFSEMWTEGRNMELAQVLTYAFEADSAPIEQVTAREPILLALEMKDALPTDAKPPEPNQADASSDLPPGVLSSPPLSPRRALQQHFGGLTSREREVARLVAQGKSNRAIADELVVGVSTVEAHISHIFTKLGFSSRAQIAAWAVDKGLGQVPQDLEVPRQKH